MRYLADAVVWYQYRGGETAPEIEGSEWSTLQVGRFTPGEKALITTQLDDGWAPESVWKLWWVDLMSCDTVSLGK
jgi:hypothetical protein